MEPINALAESADVNGLLFCGTDGGLYVSMDGGLSWSVAHPDLPRVPVHDLVIQEQEDDLVIGTHGRSIWVLDIAVGRRTERRRCRHDLGPVQRARRPRMARRLG